MPSLVLNLGAFLALATGWGAIAVRAAWIAAGRPTPDTIDPRRAQCTLGALGAGTVAGFAASGLTGAALPALLGCLAWVLWLGLAAAWVGAAWWGRRPQG